MNTDQVFAVTQTKLKAYIVNGLTLGVTSFVNCIQYHKTRIRDHNQ